MTWIRHDLDEIVNLGPTAVLRKCDTQIRLYPTFEDAVDDQDSLLIYLSGVTGQSVAKVFDGVYTLLERGANAIDIGALAKRVKGESL